MPHTPEFWQSFAASGKAVLLLDAFDEIDPTLVSSAVTDIENMADLYRDSLQIVVTSRPDADIQRSSRFRVLRLSRLRRADHSPFLRKICADRDQADSLLKVLRASAAEVGSLLTTPLMLTLLVILYKSSQTIPDTVPRFYEELFDVLFYRHDQNKPGFRRKRFTSLDDGAMRRLFCAFCFFVRLQRLGSLTESQFTDCAARAAEACKLTVDTRALRSELVKTICLLQEDGFELSFIHKSVVQYYAAAFVSTSSDGFATKFYQLAASSRDWALDLRFLQEIDQYRYSKYYQLPLVESIANELGVPLASNALINEAQLIHAMSNELSVIVDVSERDSSIASANQHPFEVEIVGCSNEYERRDLVRTQLTSEFTTHILLHLETTAQTPKIVVEPVHSSGLVFVPIEAFGELPADVVRRAATSVARKLREMHLKSSEVVAAEASKVAMLASFIDR